MLEDLNVFAYKIASMDLVNLPLIKYTAQTMKPMILSTGMSTISNIEDAIDTILRRAILILFFYTVILLILRLKMNESCGISTLKNTFKVPVGLSDHTFGLFVSQIALSIGACVIERHFTISRSMVGPDHILSSEIDEMTNLQTLQDEFQNYWEWHKKHTTS